MKVASVREVVLGAPLRVILKHLASRALAPGMDQLVSLVHRPNESFFVFPQVSYVLVFYIKVRCYSNLIFRCIPFKILYVLLK